jgi:hypothetical protein
MSLDRCAVAQLVSAISCNLVRFDDDGEEVPYENGWPHSIHFELRGRIVDSEMQPVVGDDDSHLSYISTHGLIDLLGMEHSQRLPARNR